MTVKINRLDGTNNQGKNPTELFILLAQDFQKLKVENGFSALTDNSTGDPTPASVSIQDVAAFVEVADGGGGGTSADATAAAAVLVTIKNAIKELSVRAEAIADLIGIPSLVADNGAGAAVDGTIAAIDTTVTAATTGAQDTETNASRVTINNAFLEVATLVNDIARALGQTELVIDIAGTPTGTIALITTTVGSAGDPAITKVAFDAAVVKWTDNVAYLAATLNSFVTDSVPKVAVQP